VVAGLAAVIALLMAAVVAAAPIQPAPTVLFAYSDTRLDEISGIARGIASPGVFYVHNDSGDPARLFALDARTGLVRAVIHVPGVANHDWEDIAVAPDASGKPSVWIADTGDNRTNRSEVEIYRIDEPKVGMSANNAAVRSSRPDIWRLRYPAGPVDVESIAVSPRGRAYLVAKTDLGPSEVFAVPREPAGDRVQVAKPIGRITIRTAEGPSLIPRRLRMLTTGAALSRDGSILAVRTYLEAYLWHVRHADVAAALRTSPTILALPLQPQGEGICIDGDHLVVDSEGRLQPVWSVALPAGFRPAVRPPRTPAPAASSRISVTPSAATSPRATASADHSLGVAARVAVVLGAALVGVGAWRVSRRRRRRG
jgi:hypothetical protein